MLTASIGISVMGDRVVAARYLLSILAGLVIAALLGKLAWGMHFKRNRLIKSGICCDAEIIKVVWDKTIRIPRYKHFRPAPIMIVFARYTYRGVTREIEGKRLFQSFLDDNASKYTAKVWVNEEKPKDTYLQLFYEISKPNK